MAHQHWRGGTLGAILIMGLSLTFLSGCMTGCIGRTHEQTTSFTLPPPPEASGISVETRNGAVTIRRAQTDRIAIEARLVMTSPERLEQTTITANRSEADGTLEVKAIPPGNSWRSREGCSFNIEIPETSSVNVRTSNGRIEITGLAGPATLKSSNGRIIVGDHDGDVSAESSNGRIEITDATGRIRVRTSNGAVSIRPGVAGGDLSPLLDVRTSNGAITVQLPSTFVGRMQMRTSNGSINVDEGLHARLHRTSRRIALVSFGAAEDQSELSELRTSNGSITVRPVPARAAEGVR